MANWFTSFKTIKNGKIGLLNYLKYLQDTDAASHVSDGHKILNNKDYKDSFNLLSADVDDAYNNKLLNNKKGGRPPSKFGTSVVVALPLDSNNFTNTDLNNTKNLILIDFIEKIFKEQNIENKELISNYLKKIYSNIHLKNTGSKIQFNYVLSEYLTENIKIDLSKKKYSFMLKEIVNKQVKKVLKVDRTEYLQQEYSNKFQHKINQNTYKFIKAREELDAEKKDLEIEKLKYKESNNIFYNLQNEISEKLTKIETLESEYNAARKKNMLEISTKKYKEIKAEKLDLNDILEKLNNMENIKLGLIKPNSPAKVEYEEVDVYNPFTKEYTKIKKIKHV